MNYTSNFNLKKPETSEYYNVEDFNENMDKVDSEIGAPTYTESTSLTKLTSGEKIATALGKISKAITDLISHVGNKSNPHGVTKSQVGLGSVPNVATNDQTPTYTEATTLATLKSGEKLSVSMGKIMKAITDLISHIANKSNPHGVTKSQVGLGNVDNTSDANKPISTAQQSALDKKADLGSDGKVLSSQLPSYVDDVLEYAGKANFPTTGESGKIYVDTSTNLTYRWSGTAYVEISQSLALGETSSTAYRGDRGKISYDHSQKTSGNPHGVTKSDVGLGNVPNVATNDLTPTFTVASTLATLVSGEKLSVSMGKIMKAITDYISHKTTSATASVLGHVKITTGNGLSNSSGTVSMGKGTDTAIGAVKLSDSFTELVGSASGSIGASQAGLYNLFIKGKALDDKITELNSNLHYKYLQSIALGESLTLPTGWNELIVITENNAGRPNLSFSIPAVYVPKESGTKAVSNGYYANNNYFGYASIQISLTTIKFSEHTHIGSNINGSKIYIYYR